MKHRLSGTFYMEISDGVRINAKIITLLMLIENTGSLKTAVDQLGMSYSHAWNTLYKINCQLEHVIVKTQRGGKGGGIATVTHEGKKLIQQFNSINMKFNEFLNNSHIEL